MPMKIRDAPNSENAVSTIHKYSLIFYPVSACNRNFTQLVTETEQAGVFRERNNYGRLTWHHTNTKLAKNESENAEFIQDNILVKGM
jgi:hypothetical protein